MMRQTVERTSAACRAARSSVPMAILIGSAPLPAVPSAGRPAERPRERRLRLARRRLCSGAVAAMLGAVAPAPLALAQTPPASGAPGAGNAEVGWWLLLFAALAVIAVVGTAVAAARRRRLETALLLQARISDDLLRDPTLSKAPLVATADVPLWPPGADTVLTLKGTVESAAMRDEARMLVHREIEGSGAHVVLVDRVAVKPQPLAHAA